MQILEHILKIRREKEKQKFSFRIAKFAMWFSHCEISHCEIRCDFSHCEIRNVVFRIAKFAMWFSHCEISHCEIRCGFSHCEIRSTLRTVCELIAKIPTVLPSDFVLRITFSSELRFRRFWYRWKA